MYIYIYLSLRQLSSILPPHGSGIHVKLCGDDDVDLTVLGDSCTQKKLCRRWIVSMYMHGIQCSIDENLNIKGTMCISAYDKFAFGSLV